MSSFNFLEIVELLNCVYCMGQLLEFVAFIWLRMRCASKKHSFQRADAQLIRTATCLPCVHPSFRYPTLHRPYRIPLPTWGCILMLAPACALLVGLLVVPWVQVRLWHSSLAGLHLS